MLLVLAAGLRLVILTAREAERQRRIDVESGLPNKLALDTRVDTGNQQYFVAAQIDDFDALQLAVGQERFGDLLRRLVERLQVAGGASSIFRLDNRTLVWSTPARSCRARTASRRTQSGDAQSFRSGRAPVGGGN